MKKLFVTIALGAAVISTPALAQGLGGGQRDQTRAEAQQRADMMFQMMDSNKDGTVTRAEAEQALAQFEAMRGGGGDARNSGRMQRMLDMAFANAQSITLQQFEGQALSRFDAMDLNHDGTVTSAEREQMRAMRQGQGAAPAAPTTPPMVQSPVPVQPHQ